MKLYQYDCGCIGFEKDDNGYALIISPCDNDISDLEDYKMVYKKMIREIRAKLNEDETKRHLDNLRCLVQDGYALRQIKSLLS